MQWYYSKNSTQLGPVSDAELREKLASGEVMRTDLVWREGMPDWIAVAHVAELSTAMPNPPQILPSGQAGGASLNSPYIPPVSASGYAQPLANIPNYLWQAIVVTILCCWPLGIPAIVYAAKVDGLKAAGNITGAMEASANAKKWCVISLIAWGVLIGVYIVIAVVAGLASH